LRALHHEGGELNALSVYVVYYFVNPVFAVLSSILLASRHNAKQEEAYCILSINVINSNLFFE